MRARDQKCELGSLLGIQSMMATAAPGRKYFFE